MHPRGFTLIEVLVALTLLGILAGLAGPSYRNFILDTRLTTTANDLRESLVLVRGEAIKRGREMTLVAGSGTEFGDWQDGWTVFRDDDADGQPDAGEIIVLEHGAIADTLQLGVMDAAAPAAVVVTIRVTSTGAVAAGISAPLTLSLCDTRSGEQGRQLAVSRIGRPTMSALTCS